MKDMNLISTLLLAASIFSAAVASAQSLQGDWTGKLQVTPQMALKLVLHISEKGGVTMDSPGQGAYGIEGETVYVSADSLDFKVSALGMSYAGCRNGDVIEGTFRQGGMSLPLAFRKSDEARRRPQTPRPPYPYTTEDVTIANGDVLLSGTLTLPERAGAQTPVVVMVTGSGLQNRDEEVFEHKPFAVIADYLARRGIASLRYDDRGFGKSTGDPTVCTTADLAGDAASVVEWLRKEKKLGKTGLLGHSEGGTISYMLGAEPDMLDFIVSIAGPAVRGDSILVAQNLNALSKSGITGGVAADFEEALRKAFRLKMDNPQPEIFDIVMTEIYPTWKSSPLTMQLAAGIRKMLEERDNPWMQFFIGHSPAADLEAFRIPAFLIFGEKDTQVPAAANAEAARRHAPLATVKTYPSLNHMMQHATTGNVEEYAEIEETISLVVLTDIADFILKAVASSN